MQEYEEHRGKGSFPAMITPAYLNAKKANELASDVSMKLDVSANMGQIQNACYSLSGVILFEQLKSFEDISCFLWSTKWPFVWILIEYALNTCFQN